MTVLRQTFRSPILYATARATELAFPLLRLYAHHRVASRPAPPSQWHTGLLMGADHIGDVLYLTASLPALKQAFPACEWLIAVSGPAGAILENNPCVTPVVIPPQRAKRGPALAAALQGRPVDACICYNSGGYWADLLDALALGIPNRVGYVHKGCSAWVTHPVAINFPQPYTAYFRDLVSQLTGQPGDWPLRPRVYPSDRDCSEAAALWEDLRLGQTPVLACFPFTRQPTATWSERHFMRALKDVAEITGVQLLLCGGKEDGPRLAAMARQGGLTCPILAGRLNLRALTEFLKRCAVAFTNDSGPRHLANAAGIPVVYFRNLWFRRAEAGSYVDSEIDLAPDRESLGGRELQQALETWTPAVIAERLTFIVRQVAANRPDRGGGSLHR